MSPRPISQVVWQIRSQFVPTASQVYLHLYFHVAKCYQIVVYSFNARLKRGRGGSAVANIKGHNLTPYSTVHSGAPWEANPYSPAR